MSFWKVRILLVTLAGFLISSSGMAQREDVSLGPIVRINKSTKPFCTPIHGQNGEVCTMTHTNAKRYCVSRGTRLPTSKQLALALHRKGLSPTQCPECNTYPDNEGSVFFYDFHHYEQPKGDNGRFLFWSSTKLPDGDAYTFDGFDGYIAGTDLNLESAVRCSIH